MGCGSFEELDDPVSTLCIEYVVLVVDGFDGFFEDW